MIVIRGLTALVNFVIYVIDFLSEQILVIEDVVVLKDNKRVVRRILRFCPIAEIH